MFSPEQPDYHDLLAVAPHSVVTRGTGTAPRFLPSRSWPRPLLTLVASLPPLFPSSFDPIGGCVWRQLSSCHRLPLLPLSTPVLTAASCLVSGAPHNVTSAPWSPGTKQPHRAAVPDWTVCTGRTRARAHGAAPKCKLQNQCLHRWETPLCHQCPARA